MREHPELFRDHSWQVQRPIQGGGEYWGIQPGSAMCKIRAFPAELTNPRFMIKILKELKTLFHKQHPLGPPPRLTQAGPGAPTPGFGSGPGRSGEAWGLETESFLHGCCSVTQLRPPGRTWGWESSAGGEAGGGRIRLRACGRAYPGETSVHSQPLAAPSQETAPEKPIWRRPPDTRRGPGPTRLRPSPAQRESPATAPRAPPPRRPLPRSGAFR